MVLRIMTVGLTAMAVVLAGCGPTPPAATMPKASMKLLTPDDKRAVVGVIRDQLPEGHTARFRGLQVRVVDQPDNGNKRRAFHRETVCGEVSRANGEFRPFFYVLSGTRDGQPLPKTELLVLEADDNVRVDRLYRLFCRDGVGLDLGGDG